MWLFNRPECIGNIEIFTTGENDWRIDSSTSARLTSMVLIHYFENILRNPFREISTNILYEVIIRINKDTAGNKDSSKIREFWITYADKLYKSFEEAKNMFFVSNLNQNFKVNLKLYKRKKEDSPLGCWYFVNNKFTVLSSNEENLTYRFHSFLALYNYCHSLKDESICDFIAMSLAHLLTWYKEKGIPTWRELAISGNMAMLYYFGYKKMSNEIVRADFEKYIQGQKVELYAERIS